MTELELAQGVVVGTVAAPGDELVRFEASVRGMLEQLGLPAEHLFVSVGERVGMVGNVGRSPG